MFDAKDGLESIDDQMREDENIPYSDDCGYSVEEQGRRDYDGYDDQYDERTPVFSDQEWDRGWEEDYYRRQRHDKRDGYRRVYYQEDDCYYDSGCYRWRQSDYHVSRDSYGYQRYENYDYDSRDQVHNRRWSYDSYYSKTDYHQDQRSDRRMNYYNNVGYDQYWDEEHHSPEPEFAPNDRFDADHWDDNENATDEYIDETKEMPVEEKFEENYLPEPSEEAQMTQSKSKDDFESFKTGPFHKRRNNLKSEENKEKIVKDKPQANASSIWLKSKLKKNGLKSNVKEKKEKSTNISKPEKRTGVDDPPKQIMFATIVPNVMRKAAQGKVKSILGSKFKFYFNPGAKHIDVISRVMFPGEMND